MSPNPAGKTVGRFAPSPSGRMHLGNALAALLAWLAARSADGALVLRMEDLDPVRCTQEWADALRQDLRWLGLDWDAESPRQRLRTSAYQQALSRLEARGLVYPCWCTRGDLHAAAAPHASDGHAIYAGACRHLTPAQRTARSGPASLRLMVPEQVYTVNDGLQGPYGELLSRDCGDFVLRRADGVFAYQLAVVVDDIAAGVNQVVRGRDLLTSTPRQLYLYELLGATPPRYWHTPLLQAADGRRLCKRDGDVDFGQLRQRISAPALVGYLAFLLQLIPQPESLTPRELLPEFSWDKLPSADISLLSDDVAADAGGLEYKKDQEYKE